MQKGTIQLNAVVVGMSLWCLAISQALQHPLYELLMTALDHIPAEEFDTPGLQRICTVRPCLGLQHSVQTCTVLKPQICQQPVPCYVALVPGHLAGSAASTVRAAHERT